uniref:GntR family transcriptional regulator n=1 Tax=uncultured Thiotrichaceae bacterium TaxID=298394 RepID=A0A6S6UNW8_9GAMM|nr:MAG: GntR family transcriptional regulator [uncultured Thiotrichaceae bacterium]
MVGQIEGRILSGELKDGETLPAERDLMGQFGTSRTVVREAVATLASRGLVETKPRFRPVVRKPNYESAVDAVGNVISHLLQQSGGIKNLFETRILLEAALVREAALNATADDIETLRSALQANRDTIDDSKQFYDTDMAFHGVLYSISGNPVWPAVHKAYTSWLAEHWMQMPRMPDRNQKSYEAHEAIFNAIANRDADKAEAELRRHLSISWQNVKATFGEL